jgi:outer membrane lipoprotein LolB
MPGCAAHRPVTQATARATWKRVAGRHARMLAAGLAACVLSACALLASPPLPQGERFNGRLSVRVENDAQRSFSAGFELAGTDRNGVLSLSTPLGTQLARAMWSPGRVELKTPQRTAEYPTLDQLAVEALGENVPIAALFDWLSGRPWPGAPSQPRPAGFEQLGWNVDLARQASGAIVATRVQPAPAVVVRVRLDQP